MARLDNNLHQGQWIAKASEVPKGKFLKKNTQNPGGMRIIAMAARGGWLWSPAQQARSRAAIV